MLDFPNEDARWAWVAGLIEGEGCLNIAQVRLGKFIPEIRMTNTKKELLEVLQSVIGGQIYQMNSRGHNPMFQLVVNDKQNISSCIPKIMPFLVVKKRQGELLLNLLNSSDLTEKHAIFAELRLLHKRQKVGG